MALKKFTALAIIIMFASIAVFIGCDADSTYHQRTVVYVSNFNDGSPYFADVLNQGDSIYVGETTRYKIEDDYVEEDWVKVEIHNRPYNSLINTSSSSLGDFLVTGYDVSFARTDGGSGTPVGAFTGSMSTLVPANSKTEVFILLVPFESKNDPTLHSLWYSSDEILARADITFHGHEIQTDRELQFSASFGVTFGDALEEDDSSSD